MKNGCLTSIVGRRKRIELLLAGGVPAHQQDPLGVHAVGWEKEIDQQAVFVKLAQLQTRNSGNSEILSMAWGLKEGCLANELFCLSGSRLADDFSQIELLFAPIFDAKSSGIIVLSQADPFPSWGAHMTTAEKESRPQEQAKFKGRMKFDLVRAIGLAAYRKRCLVWS